MYLRKQRQILEELKQHLLKLPSQVHGDQLNLAPCNQ